MCAPCAAKAAARSTTSRVARKKTVLTVEAVEAENSECRFNNEVLNYFNDNLAWYKSSGLYLQYGTTARELTRYRGIVLSALNTSRKCFYETQLGEIEDLVTFIITIRP